MARTDIHTIKNFNAPDYRLIDTFGVVSFDAGDYIEQEEYGYDSITDAVRAAWSGVYSDNTEKCDVCGANYVHGSLWLHNPTSTYITIGQTCASNVGLAVSSDVRLTLARRIKRLARVRKWRREGSAKAKMFLVEFPQVARDLVQKHRILRDMAHNLVRWGNMSEGQIKFAAKLADEVRTKTAAILAGDDLAEPEAVEIPASYLDGRVKVSGTILGLKDVEGYMGGPDITKMLVEVIVDGGAFKLWGTVPNSLWNDPAADGLKGQRVEFMGRVEMSPRDKTFGFIKRPTKCAIITE